MSAADTPFSIFRATASDRELARAALQDVSGRQVDGAALEAYLADPNCYLLVATEARPSLVSVGGSLDRGGRRGGHPEEAKHPVGTLAGQAIRRAHEARPQFLLYEIDVKETRRRKGVGRALIERYREDARAAGASEIWVLTNASNRAAMALYEQCGMARPNPDDVMWVLPIESA